MLVQPLIPRTVLEGVGVNRLTQNLSMATLDGAYQISDAETVNMAQYVHMHSPAAPLPYTIPLSSLVITIPKTGVHIFSIRHLITCTHMHTHASALF